MAKPVILAVDDEPAVLSAVERDIRSRYGRDYRTIKAGSGREALATVQQLAQRNRAIALFVADQRMPEMNGTEFLAEAIKLYPDTRRVLLTAYADTEAAIASINSLGLDYYLRKPWSPPEETLYPVLDDLLSDWQATVPVPYDGIRVAGTQWSAKCHFAKNFLARNQIPYQWLDIEKNAEAKELVDRIDPGEQRLPIVFFPDGTTLAEPDNDTLAKKAGLTTEASKPFYDVIIIGGGPGGLGAAVYGASEGLSTALIEREAVGGQAGTSSRIENYLGFPNGLSGADLARRAEAQARRFGAEVLIPHEVRGIRVEDSYRIVTLENGSELSCHALIIATGVSARKLSVPGIDHLSGAGVYYGAALTEAANFKDQPVVVVGGANSAGQGAMYFSRFASKVLMLVRADSLAKRMSQYLVNQIEGTENIEVLVDTEVVELLGEDRLTGVSIKNRETGNISTLPAAALFSFIGAVPHTQMVAGVVERNAAGFIVTGQDLIRDGKRPRGWALKRDPMHLETSVPGIFAVGDVRQGAMARVASAVGTGAIAIGLIHQYLKTV
ncbi:MAG: FAD-dependent oxidoreductase [Trueperaceae bacterium]|nr:MAG: FAD-dependent oxidoreductase [Trueperaceae bacterium]